MSAEVETSKEQPVKEQKPRKPLKLKLKENWAIGFKILELLLCAICMGLSYQPVLTVGLAQKYLHHVGIMYTAYTGYMIINCIMLISRGIGDKIPYRTTALFAVIGAVLFLTTGILLAVDIANYLRQFAQHLAISLKPQITTAIVFAFINCIVFTLDAIFTFIPLILTTDRSSVIVRNLYHPRIYLLDMITGAIIVTYLNIIIFVADAVVTLKKKEDF